jgi:hypothetical protein
VHDGAVAGGLERARVVVEPPVKERRRREAEVDAGVHVRGLEDAGRERVALLVLHREIVDFPGVGALALLEVAPEHGGRGAPVEAVRVVEDAEPHGGAAI